MRWYLSLNPGYPMEELEKGSMEMKGFAVP